MDRWSDQIEREDYRAALVAVTIANRHRNKNEQTHRIDDYVLHKRSRSRTAPVRPKQTRQDQIAVAAALTSLLGGVVALPPGTPDGQ